MIEDFAVRWRLILGEGAEKIDAGFRLSADGVGSDELKNRQEIDEALSFVYDPTPAENKNADLGAPAAYVPIWLDLVRRSFSQEVVSVLFQDALERRGLKELLLEPESLSALEPNPQLIATLLAMKDLAPAAARSAIRELVRKLVAQLQSKIQQKLITAVRQGVRTRTLRHGSFRSLNWGRTVRANLRHYDTSTRQILPQQFYFHGSDRIVGEWRVILLVDQSGSMAESVIHAAVAAAILSSIRALRTHLVFFGSEIADMTDRVSDPVEILMGAQIGGGTDIAAAVGYAADLAQDPARTLLVLITDLYEGGDEQHLLARLAALNESRCRTACVLALNSDGRADYNERLAGQLRDLGTPCLAASPNSLPDLFAQLWAATWPPG